MLLFLKKKSDEPEMPENGEEPDAPDFSKFLPYYCHYDPHTLLTVVAGTELGIPA